MGAEASSESVPGPIQGEGADGKGLPYAPSREEGLNRTSSNARPVIAGKAVTSVPRVLLRGERGSGKSSLFMRLHGTPFDEGYVPTDKIQASSVSWSIRNSRERKRVSVEIWVVVDVHDGDDPDETFDADGDGSNAISVPDTFNEISSQKIYKKTQGVIFVINPFSATSLEYVRRNIASVPADIDILIIFGFKDLVEKMDDAPATKQGNVRVAFRDVKRMVDEYKEDGREAITIIEASVYSGFGLRDLYKFLYLPFIHLQEQALRAKLNFLGKERIRTTAEVHSSNSDRGKYEEYMKAFKAKKKAAAGNGAARDNVSTADTNQFPADGATSRTQEGAHADAPAAAPPVAHPASRGRSTSSSSSSVSPASAPALAPAPAFTLAPAPASPRQSPGLWEPSHADKGAGEEDEYEEYDFDEIKGDEVDTESSLGAGRERLQAVQQKPSSPRGRTSKNSGNGDALGRGSGNGSANSTDDAIIRKQLQWMEEVKQKNIDKEREKERDKKKEKKKDKERSKSASASGLITSHHSPGGSSGGDLSSGSGVSANSKSRFSMSPQTLDFGDHTDDTNIDDFNPSSMLRRLDSPGIGGKSRGEIGRTGNKTDLSDFLKSESVDSSDGAAMKGKKGASKGLSRAVGKGHEDSDDDLPMRKRAPSFKKAVKKPAAKRKMEEGAQGAEVEGSAGAGGGGARDRGEGVDKND